MSPFSALLLGLLQYYDFLAYSGGNTSAPEAVNFKELIRCLELSITYLSSKLQKELTLKFRCYSCVESKR